MIAFNYPGLQEDWLGVIAGGHPVLVDKLPVLGVWIDPEPAAPTRSNQEQIVYKVERAGIELSRLGLWAAHDCGAVSVEGRGKRAAWS